MDNLCGAKIKRVGQKSFWTRYIIIKVRNPLTTFKEREEEEEEEEKQEAEDDDANGKIDVETDTYLMCCVDQFMLCC